ncbi:uroporphyrinogen-III C-methyltransferase [Caldicellulosiruptoraceae bacterium PP1]
MSGKVYLIGAGIGTEELLTIKAMKIIQECDVILYDKLIDKNILNYTKHDCIKIFCGKENKRHYMSQDEINYKLVEYAKNGMTVCRLKGGDPYIYGRGSEEAIFLSNNNIEFEVIPGISSIYAALNFCGIPITHRGVSNSIHVFTASSLEDDLDFQIISKLEGTIIFLMAREKIPFLIEQLLNNKTKQQLAAIISSAGTSKQKCIVDTLVNLSGRDFDISSKEPTMFVLSDTIGFRKLLNWYENKILFGKKVVLCCPKGHNIWLKQQLQNMGAEVVEINSMYYQDKSENVQSVIDRLASYNYIVFTSKVGVDSFFEFLKKNNIDIRNIKAQYVAIGEKTANKLKSFCINEIIIPNEYTSKELFLTLKEKLTNKDKILLIRSENADNILTENIKEITPFVDDIRPYKFIQQNNIVFDINDIKDAHIYVFTSSAFFDSFINIYDIIDILKYRTVIAIGPATKERIEKYGIYAILSSVYSQEGILEKILEVTKNV